MRFFIYILSFLILSLSCIPCADSLMDLPKGENIAAQQAGTTNSHHKDECSPLCICACCGNVSFVSLYSSVNTPAVRLIALHYSYNTAAVQEIPLPIWQPPQLS
ncbi:hypothetical protein DVR12_03960 [Chitinophaga silvatica]|uniref:DUF2946 domain-containing protein n=1 Tax=Chitinophaga silvatica TaxID=2282649 RepID=A0A3E1YHW9_9BACT|nr:DUF6660 family protein [Chitinophaga silvatica]RFS26948.1 hypothetical protein DVR12_03960 [Chitinophaga silvatica]